MTMVEDKETKVKSMDLPSSDYAAIVPIKKRRFPLVLPPSPPRDEPCPTPEPNEKQQDSTSAFQSSTIFNITPEEGKPQSPAISLGVGASSASQQSEYAPADQDKLGPLSMQPELTKRERESTFDRPAGAMKSKSDATDLCTDRSNWDLNTTMDIWEGSAGDATSISTDHRHGTFTTCGDRANTKPVVSPTEMSEVNLLGAAFSVPADEMQAHDDSLKLGLQIPSPSNFSREHVDLSAYLNVSTTFSRVSSAGSSSIVSPMAVKSELYEETQKKAFLATDSRDLKSLVGKVVKREAVDKDGLAISSSMLKLFSPKSLLVKAEPAFEGAPVTISTNAETSNILDISQGMVLDPCNKVTESLPVNCSAVRESQTVSNRLDDYRPNGEGNEYEDGEVKERTVADGPVGLIDGASIENVSTAEGEPENVDYAGNPSYPCADSPPNKKEDSDMQLCSDMELEETFLDEKSRMSEGLERHLQDLSDVEVESDINRPESIAQGTIQPPGDENQRMHSDIAGISGEATELDHELAGAFTQDVNAMRTGNNLSNDDAENNGSILPKAESSVNSDPLGRVCNIENSRSRIINLSGTLNTSSPDKTSPALDRSMHFHDGRRRLPNVALEGDKLHLRGRDEAGNADFQRFSRGRSRDMFYQNNRSGFARDRGRVPSNMCPDWEIEQDFGSEMHNGPREFHSTRYRYNSGYRNYNNSREEGFVGSRRGGRRLLADNSANFHGPPSMRSAHGGRDGPATREPPMVGRVRRDMSPNRSISMDDSNLVGVRHGFVRQERNIGSFGRKGLHHVRSRSPERLRSRSPVQWSSPRRRSPEEFVRRTEMVHRRTSPMYRRQRMGSPERACIRGEVTVRRQNSPPYGSRRFGDVREMNTGGERGFSRPIMRNGNSFTTRVSLRNQRYETGYSREGMHGEYDRVPMRGSRFNELPGDDNIDERRRLNERRGPVRHLRLGFGSDDKGFTYSSDDGSRSYRPCPENGSSNHEGGSSRERQMERHPENDNSDAVKTRNNEDQELGFRSGGSAAEFDDAQR